MLKTLCDRWQVVLLHGILAVVLGVTAVMWPGITLVSLVWVFAAFAIIDGVACVVLGIRGGTDGKLWWAMILMGVVSIAAGILSFAMPGVTALVLLAIIAWSAIVRGVFQIWAAISLRKAIDDEWILGISGAFSILFGVLLLARPGAGALTVVLLIGAYMMAIGVMAIALALRLRRIKNKMSHA
jgi:uncharacterized membrane protein HdeD (DUF308 family)